MQGGEIIRQKEGHPIKGIYWSLAFNGTEGVKALEFIKNKLTQELSQKNNICGVKNF